MSDERDMIGRMFDGMNRISLLAQLKDKVIEARDTDQRRCGNCRHWMKSRECPREHNVNGYTRGPSCGDLACSKFILTERVAGLKVERVNAAIAFARQHDLPIPELKP